MNAQTQAAIDEIIQIIEVQEAEIREGLLSGGDKAVLPPFTGGNVNNITAIRYCIDEKDKDGNDYQNNYFYCEFQTFTQDIPAVNRAVKKETLMSVDLSFLTKEIVDNDFAPALKAWWQNKIEQETFGGLYDFDFVFYLKLATNNLPIDKSETWCEQIRFYLLDQNRQKQYEQKLEQSVITESYRDLKKLLAGGYDYKYIQDTYTLLAGEAFERLGKEKLLPMSKVFLEKAHKGHNNSEFAKGIVCATEILTDISKQQVHTPDELWVAYQLGSLFMNDKKLNAKFNHKYDYEKVHKAMMQAAESGQVDAGEMLGIRAKRTPEEILKEAEQYVTCKADRDSAVVTFVIKEENAKAYIAMLTYLTELLKNDFPPMYKIEFNSAVQNYIPTELEKTQTNNFFTNAATYSEAHSALEDYTLATYSYSYKYYGDSDGETAVPLGGYAAMALAFADPVAYYEIAEWLISNSDLDHAISVRSFIKDYAKICKGANKKKINKYVNSWEQ